MPDPEAWAAPDPPFGPREWEGEGEGRARRPLSPNPSPWRKPPSPRSSRGTRSWRRRGPSSERRRPCRPSRRSCASWRRGARAASTQPLDPWRSPRAPGSSHSPTAGRPPSPRSTPTSTHSAPSSPPSPAPSYTSASSLSLATRNELCHFSGYEIYPGKGIRFIHSDSQEGSKRECRCQDIDEKRLPRQRATPISIKAKKIVDNNYDKLQMHGQGKDYSPNWWKALGGLLLAHDYLKDTVRATFRFVSVSPKGIKFLSTADKMDGRPLVLLLRKLDRADALLFVVLEKFMLDSSKRMEILWHDV